MPICCRSVSKLQIGSFQFHIFCQLGSTSHLGKPLLVGQVVGLRCFAEKLPLHINVVVHPFVESFEVRFTAIEELASKACLAFVTFMAFLEVVTSIAYLVVVTLMEFLVVATSLLEH